MSIEVVVGIVAIVLGLIGGGVGWSRIEKHGAAKSEKKQVKKELNAAKKREHDKSRPDLTPAEHAAFIDSL